MGESRNGLSPSAGKLAVLLRAPGLDLSGSEASLHTWLGRLLQAPCSEVQTALAELRDAGRLVVRPSPLGGGLMRYTVGPSALELDDDGLDDEARAELDDGGLDDDGQTVALLRGEGAVIASVDPSCLGRALARLARA